MKKEAAHEAVRQAQAATPPGLEDIVESLGTLATGTDPSQRAYYEPLYHQRSSELAVLTRNRQQAESRASQLGLLQNQLYRTAMKCRWVSHLLPSPRAEHRGGQDHSASDGAILAQAGLGGWDLDQSHFQRVPATHERHNIIKLAEGAAQGTTARHRQTLEHCRDAITLKSRAANCAYLAAHSRAAAATKSNDEAQTATHLDDEESELNDSLRELATQGAPETRAYFAPIAARRLDSEVNQRWISYGRGAIPSATLA